MKTKDVNHSFFIGINEDHRGDGHSLTLTLIFKVEEQDMFSHKSSYLFYKYDKFILKYFASPDLEQALASQWDNEIYCAQNPELE